MEQEMNYLSEKIEALNWRINELLVDGCEGEVIDGIIHEHSMLENILTELTIAELTGSMDVVKQ
jgi:hypothetical protein